MFHLTTCPTCQTRFSIPEGNMQKRHVCPNCKTPFQAGKSNPEPAAPMKLDPAGGEGYNKTMLGETEGPPIRFNCPRCKRPQEASVSEAGMKKNCASCGQRYQVPAAPAPVAAAAAAPQPNLNKTMLTEEESPPVQAPPIRYNCPNCKKPQEVPATEASTKRNCASCGQRHLVPATSAKQSNLNKTMLTEEEPSDIAPAPLAPRMRPGPGAPVDRESGRTTRPASAAQDDAAPSWPMNMSPQARLTAAIVGGVLLLLLLLMMLAPSHDRQAFAAAKKEADDLEAKMKEIKQEKERLREEERRNEREREKYEEAKRNYAQLAAQVAALVATNSKSKVRLEQEYDKLSDIQDEDLRLGRKRELDRQKAKLFEEERKNKEALDAIEEQKRKQREEERRAEREQQEREERKMRLELDERRQSAALQAALISASRPPYYPWHPYRYWPFP